MVLDIYRIAKDGKLTALIWKELDVLFIKESNFDIRPIQEKASDTTLMLYIKSYCDNTGGKNINKVSLEKSDINGFIDTVNNSLPNPNRKKLQH